MATYESAQGWVQQGADITSVTFANGDVFGARATVNGQVSVYKNGSLLGTRDVSSWPYYDDGGYIGVWFVNASAAYGDDFGGGTVPGSSLVGVKVKASLVKVAHDEKAFRKAQTLLQAPPSGQVWKSYYFTDSVRLALRVQVNGVGDKVYYLLTDHLGSTTVSYRSDGQETRTQSYKPWGEVRGNGNSLPTDRTFTGQRWSASIGLSFFNARWYDNALGRFVQADSVIPSAGNPQAWDRYAGLGNNPVNYSDPTGHIPQYIAGWKDQYKQKQVGNTCAVVSMAVAVSIVYGSKITQEDLQILFPNTYIGIGVVPKQQSAILNLDLEIKATYSQGNRSELLKNINNNLPTIVSFTLPGKDIGHAIVAIGYDPATGEIQFFNPATGDIETESTILKNYDKKRGFGTFDDLWAASNMFISSNSMVTVQRVPPPIIQPISPPSGGGGGGSGLHPSIL